MATAAAAVVDEQDTERTSGAGRDQHGVDQHGVDQHGVDQHGVDRIGDVLDRGVRRGAVLVNGVRARLPQPVPVYVGLAALACAGALSWPVAVAAGCGFAAFRHWDPQPSGMPHHPATPSDAPHGAEEES
jgi:hypothetical protein